MHAFSLFSIPLAFLALVAWKFRKGEEVFRSFAKGLLFGFPIVAVWLLARPAFAPVWGSILLPFSFLLRYWIVPLGLAIGAYALSTGLSGLAKGLDYERLVSFLFGSMSLVGIAQTVQSWGQGDPALTLAVPCLVVSSLLSLPYFIEEAAKDGMPYALGPIAMMLGILLVASLGAAFFFLRLEWLGAIVTILFCSGSTLMGLKKLSRRR